MITNKHEEIIEQIMQSKPQSIAMALSFIYMYGQIEGDHHRAWVIDQVSRCLLETDYEKWIEAMKEDGEYDYDEGIAP